MITYVTYIEENSYQILPHVLLSLVHIVKLCHHNIRDIHFSPQLLKTDTLKIHYLRSDTTI